MVDFNKEHEDGDFPIRFDDAPNDTADKTDSEKKLRDALNRLIVVWEEKEEFATDIANHQYADGVGSCLDDLKDVLLRHATT